MQTQTFTVKKTFDINSLEWLMQEMGLTCDFELSGNKLTVHTETRNEMISMAAIIDTVKEG